MRGIAAVVLSFSFLHTGVEVPALGAAIIAHQLPLCPADFITRTRTTTHRKLASLLLLLLSFRSQYQDCFAYQTGCRSGTKRRLITAGTELNDINSDNMES